MCGTHSQLQFCAGCTRFGCELLTVSTTGQSTTLTLWLPVQPPPAPTHPHPCLYHQSISGRKCSVGTSRAPVVPPRSRPQSFPSTLSAHSESARAESTNSQHKRAEQQVHHRLPLPLLLPPGGQIPTALHPPSTTHRHRPDPAVAITTVLNFHYRRHDMLRYAAISPQPQPPPPPP